MSVFKLPSVSFKPAAFLSGAPGPWAAHLPFAYDLVPALRPELVVELGVFYGDSYFGFCQSVAEHHLACSCYGVDTWRGDAHGGYYGNAVHEAVTRHNEQHYGSFSYLLRSTFDEASERFTNETIDLLHIDGFHSYDAVRHDFETWYPKVRPGGVILFHDVLVRSSDFGAWRLWEELQREHQTFTFRNSNGLGILLKRGGGELDCFAKSLFSGSEDDHEAIRRYYASCAERLQLEYRSGAAPLTDAGHSQLQAFFCQASDYGTNDDLFRIIEAGKWVEIKLRFPSGFGNCPLRIDPTNRPAVIDISAISLDTTDGSEIWNWQPAAEVEAPKVGGTAMRLPSEDSFRVFSYGIDPQIYLPCLPVVSEGAGELTLRMIIDLDFSAIRHLADRVAEPQRGDDAVVTTLLEEARVCRQAYENAQQVVTTLLEEARVCRQTYENTQQELDKIRKFQLSMIGNREEALSKLGAVQQEVEVIRSEASDARLAQSLLSGELESVRAELRAERELRMEMEGSRSWKVTKPLRSAISLIKPTSS